LALLSTCIFPLVYARLFGPIKYANKRGKSQSEVGEIRHVDTYGVGWKIGRYFDLSRRRHLAISLGFRAVREIGDRLWIPAVTLPLMSSLIMHVD